MNKLLTILLLLLLTITVNAQQTSKPRVLISTDIGGTDPDDNQSVTHLLMYFNEFDLEGLVSSPSFGDGSAKEIYRMIDVYEKDFKTLRQHNKDLMKPNALRKLVKQSRQSEMPACGYGEPTEGSKWIIKQARKKDNHPLWPSGCSEVISLISFTQIKTARGCALCGFIVRINDILTSRSS